jgi:hypothetical protein
MSYSEYHSGNATLADTTTQLLAGDFDAPVYRAVIVSASPNNTDTICVGPDQNQVNNGQGYLLQAGDSIPICVDFLRKIVVKATTGGQEYSWLSA